MTRRASGLRAWFLQRLSAIYIALYLVFLLGFFAFNPPADYAAWRNWVAAPVNSLALVVFILAVIVHAWVGMRDILIDYLKPLSLRLLLLSLVGATLLVSGLSAISVLFRIQPV